ncbi:MAG: MBOAT family protein, partial [Synergistaceae bacterium]|nr:MBOAT family protein [Synergistaceae bacterium]
GGRRFVFILIALTVANYMLGLAMGKSRKSANLARCLLLSLALATNLGVLFYYKYYDFAIANVNLLFGTQLALRHIVLPLGISFFTFQGMSYVLDVFIGKTRAQRNPLNVALYIALFPQLIAGPIVRYSDISQEIVSRREALSDFASGVQRFAVGLAKKIILANSVAPLADMAFGTIPDNLSTGAAWLGAIAYTFQIYFDFSGYSDMAIGLGRMFGFHILENFNYPYVARSVQDFWRRWHISLSTWFRDYVYIPMGGNRRGNVYAHLFTVFFLTGLWHGASWNFIVWGLWHGFFLIVERIGWERDAQISAPGIVKQIYTMLVVVAGWVFFRATNLKTAIAFLGCMCGVMGVSSVGLEYLLQDYGVTLLLCAVCALPLSRGYAWLREKSPVLRKAGIVMEPLCCGILLLVGIAYTVTSTYNPFIYFNF